MARANSLIFPRSTVTVKGGSSLPFTLLLIWMGMSGLALLHRAFEKPLQVGDGKALVLGLRDFLDLVEALHVEDMAPSVRLDHGGLGPHLHPERRGGQVLHLHRRPHGGRTRRQVPLEDLDSGVLDQAYH